MRIIDITGPIRDDMWSYEEPFPKFHLSPLPEVPWVKNRVWCEIFEGIHSQCGTYLETPAHFFGNDASYLLSEVGVEKLCDIKIHLLAVEISSGEKRPKITKEMLIDSLGSRKIESGDSIIVGCGWGKNWSEKSYLENSPYFSREAMEWLISFKPFLLGSDIPRWENLERPEGFFEDFYKADILMLAPLVNLESIDCEKDLLLTVLPLAVEGTSCAPARAVIKEFQS